MSAEARGPEKRGATTTGATAARGSQKTDGASETGAESTESGRLRTAGAGPAEARGRRKPGAEGAEAAGSQEPVAEAPGAERRASGESRATDAGEAASGREPGAGAAEAGPVREGGAVDGAAGESGGADGAAREPGGVDVGSDEVPDPEEQAEILVRDAISAPDAEGRPRRATRRFPLFTRDTAPPEGAGRAAPRDAPAPARQWPVLAVLAVVGLGLLLTALDRFRLGTLLIGVALLAGAVLRWLLPDVGMLAVRSRFTDIATYGVLGTVIVLLAMMVQPDPWLVIPFLKDTLHFTVSSS